MAAWTVAPAGLDQISSNKLALVFAEVIRAIQRREQCLNQPLHTYTPAVAYPCAEGDCVDTMIPWTYDGANKWLKEIQDTIDYLVGGATWEWAQGDNIVWEFVDAGGTAYTPASLKTAAFGAAGWTILIDKKKLYSLYRGLYEAMKCLELMNKIKLLSILAYAGTSIWGKTIRYYNQVWQPTINDAYSNLDTKAIEGFLHPISLAGQRCYEYMWWVAPNRNIYAIFHGYWYLHEYFDTKMTLWNYAADGDPGHFIHCKRNLDETCATYAVDLYGGAVNWRPVLTVADFPAAGGTFEDTHNVGAVSTWCDYTMATARLPSGGGKAYYDFRCSTAQQITSYVGDNAHDAEGSLRFAASPEVNVFYDLQAAYDPTG